MTRKLLFHSFFYGIILIFLCSFTNQESGNMVQEILYQTNTYRKSKGLSELVMRKELNVIATAHSINMAGGSVAFGHDGFERRSDMAMDANNAIFKFGENVAFGTSSANAIVNMWKQSSGHRRNMLGHFKFIGIGIAKDKQGRFFYTQFFAG